MWLPHPCMTHSHMCVCWPVWESDRDYTKWCFHSWSQRPWGCIEAVRDAGTANGTSGQNATLAGDVEPLQTLPQRSVACAATTHCHWRMRRPCANVVSGLVEGNRQRDANALNGRGVVWWRRSSFDFLVCRQGWRRGRRGRRGRKETRADGKCAECAADNKDIST